MKFYFVLFVTYIVLATPLFLQAEDLTIPATEEVVSSPEKNNNPVDSIWDFDHNVQYKQQVINDNSWHIEVIRHKNVHFEKMATFMFRKAYDLCSSYRFVIEVEDGVELFTDRKAMPNMIFGNLVTKVICLSDDASAGDPVE